MSTKLPFNKKILFVVIMITLIKFHLLEVVHIAGGVVVTNKMRYATSEKSNENKLTERAIEYAASEIRSVEKPLKSEESYRINENLLYNSSKNKFHQGRLLDEEDKSLLEEFYRETKGRDPFDKELILTENLWDDKETNSIISLIDIEQPKSPTFKHGTNIKGESNDGWTIDSDYSAPLDGSSDDNNKVITSSSNNLAKYSPTLRLLTTYNPLEEAKILSDSSSGGKIVGATLYGQDKTTMPKVNSKSATNAIKLHDDLMREPPKDGKVRVRMYYHRAIHDDARLYGNGPWKYWGHGWGVEFGYDPKKIGNNDFYQKGYTIERAFGRDFCKDKLNCRQADPNFFKDPHKVGHYSKQYAKLLPKKSNDYKIRQ